MNEHDKAWILLIIVIVGALWFTIFIEVPGFEKDFQIKYDKMYAIVKNDTISLIPSNATDDEKIQIIIFQCKAFKYDTWITQCQKDLTNELIYSGS